LGTFLGASATGAGAGAGALVAFLEALGARAGLAGTGAGAGAGFLAKAFLGGMAISTIYMLQLNLCSIILCVDLRMGSQSRGGRRVTVYPEASHNYVRGGLGYSQIPDQKNSR
jgi:hypothetical protein